MTRAGIIIAAVAFLCSTAATTGPPVTFESPCECRDNHGEHRWAVKLTLDCPADVWLLSAGKTAGEGDFLCRGDVPRRAPKPPHYFLYLLWLKKGLKKKRK